MSWTDDLTYFAQVLWIQLSMADSDRLYSH